MEELLPFIIVLFITSIGIVIGYLLNRFKPALLFLPTTIYALFAALLYALTVIFDFGMGDIALMLFSIIFSISALFNLLFVLSYRYQTKKKPKN